MIAVSSSVTDLLQDNTAVVVALAVVLLTSILLGLLALVRGKRGPVALDPEKYISFPLIEKEELSHDTRRFRFGLQSPDHILGLPIGQHISFKFQTKEGKIVTRSYTPTSSDDEKGYVDFVIKVYFANKHPKFPAGGLMSQHLESLNIGDTIEMRGPKGHLTYKGHGKMAIAKRGEVETRYARQIGMIAGGTGITPMLQVMSAIVKEKSRVDIWLLFANQTADDILVRSELEGMLKDNTNIRLWYTLDRPPAGWPFSTGFVDAEMVKKHMPEPGPDTQILMCGPGPMIKMACEPALKELGYTEDMQFVF
eukprot:CAMPEP_0113943024 /NCGR_PEP_ID=MMETSP1339-20121228/16469_1 /TAXON_ID=94617 /ORGANISM="Fibrocapsa japonica" /LENGTH=308 /DNA_ID=CAMNT_0000947755 /DNA_START=89 /DNA_END=1015 /DNA_ORIENTATION=+ /assembly_acc=CAM_ASM_000762